jgi:hypothetical protein
VTLQIACELAANIAEADEADAKIDHASIV